MAVSRSRSATVKRLSRAFLSRGQRDGLGRDTEDLGQERTDRLVGPALGGRHRDPHLERVSVAADDLGAPGARLRVDRDHDRVVGLFHHSVQVVSIVHAVPFPPLDAE